MSPERFEHLLSVVGPVLTKKSCRSRQTISAAERLMVTLRFLATGDSQQSQSFLFRIGRATVSHIVRETCAAIWTALQGQYVIAPKTTNDWEGIANEFKEEWNFPNCIGAIDGKHVMMECPKNGGSAFYNYKGFHSIVLLAVCDAKYCFTLLDIGGVGSTNDASILSESNIGRLFEKSQSSSSFPSHSSHGSKTLPYVIVGDDIFPLKPWLMKPFPGRNLEECHRVFNYRLSRARRCIENAFGILSAKWRIFYRPITGNVDLVKVIVAATVCLHKYLRLTDNANYIPAGFVDSEDIRGNIVPGDWRHEVAIEGAGLRILRQIGGNRYSYDAGFARENFMEYFNSPEGEVPWQWQHVRSCGRIHDNHC